MRRLPLCTIFVGAAALATPANAGSHLWRFNELFSNADGTVQFIEMRECCGAEEEIRLTDKWIESESTGMRFTFPEDLECCTSRRHLTLATAAFAELPGAPTPDYIIPDGFFDPSGDTLRYWMYSGARFTFVDGEVPLDGRRSLNGDRTTDVNSPTNYAHETGSVVVSCHPADLDANGVVEFNDLLALMTSWGTCPFCPSDFDRSGEVDFDDMLVLLAGWGPCR